MGAKRFRLKNFVASPEAKATDKTATPGMGDGDATKSSLWHRVQHVVRDSGLGRGIVDVMTVAGGLVKLAWTQNAAGLGCYLSPDVRWRLNQTYTAGSPPSAHAMRKFDVYPHPTRPRAPVIAFVHGGAWGSGTPFLYRILAMRFVLEGYHCVVLGYRTYPSADINGQLLDLEAALCEVRRRQTAGTLADSGLVHQKAPLILAGHSAGAHLASLLCLRRFSNLPFVNGCVAMSGVYDIAAHYEFETRRGVAEVSPMKPAAGGDLKSFKNASPIHALSALPVSTAECDTKRAGAGGSEAKSERQPKKSKPPMMLLIHGKADGVVPFSQSQAFCDAARGRVECELVLLDGVSHEDPIVRMFELKDRTRLPWLPAIEQFIERCCFRSKAGAQSSLDRVCDDDGDKDGAQHSVGSVDRGTDRVSLPRLHRTASRVVDISTISW